MGRIVFISPYRDLSLLAQSVAREMGMVIDFHDGQLHQAGEVVNSLLKQGQEIDILISRGGNAEYLKNTFPIPVIKVNTGPFDLIECISEAKQFSPKIALTSYGEAHTGVRLMEKVMDVAIAEIIFTDLNELKEQIANLSEAGYCVVGGGPSVNFARMYGMPSVFLRTSLDTLREAFATARSMAKIISETRSKLARMRRLLDTLPDGLLSVDTTGHIEYSNEAARHMIHVDEIDGEPLQKVLPSINLSDVLIGKRRVVGVVSDISDKKCLTSRLPLFVDGKLDGAVLSMTELSQVVKAEREFRQEILVRRRFRTRYSFHDITGVSAVIQEKKALAASFSDSDLTLLLYGPSGSGKELFAQSIHARSHRSRQPFVPVNCGALPPTLLESELFGYEEGAFTGAKKKGKHGLFELAHGGTIFLDEIDALPLELQGRLLRVIQEKEVLRIGGETIIPVDIRIIAATNQRPETLLSQQKIRADLFYRLNVLYLELPPLAGRQEDIPLLAQALMPSGSAEAHRLLDEAMPYMLRYPWPGNIRELNNFVQRLAFFARSVGGKEDICELIETIAPGMLGHREIPDYLTLVMQQEADLITEAINTSPTRTEAAKKLGISRATLFRRLKSLYR